jgi:hypothetical protein
MASVLVEMEVGASLHVTQIVEYRDVWCGLGWPDFPIKAALKFLLIDPVAPIHK